MFSQARLLQKPLFWIMVCFILSSCTALSVSSLNNKFGKPQPQHERIVSADSEEGRFYLNEVQPIIEKRCVVCHGCYDAPCQLKLTSPAGIDRGASTTLVYHASRLTADTPNRLGLDAQSTEEWRERGFFPVLNERKQSATANLQASLLYRMLEQKEQHPLPEGDILPSSFDLSLNRSQSCARIENYDSYVRKTPLWGMPYALPAMDNQELNILKQWLIEGAKMAWPKEPVVALHSRIQQWEQLLNGDSPKHRLVGRYLYEHWFLASLYFSDIASDHFFQLVRSATPPGEPVQIIATRRPFDDPGVQRVYYRFIPANETLLHKTHMPYALNQARLARINDWFFSDNYQVDNLPGYKANNAANPFISFKALPVQARYKFMLDEAQFTIMGFIKGPVCRGNIALNVINDHFWVFFVDPDKPLSDADDFITVQAENLSFPAENQTATEAIKYWLNYSDLQTKYLIAKSEALQKAFNNTPLELDETLVWDGYGTNDNAALTVFRHFDSATVLKGLVGQKPQTAWIIDYTLLERIHYLLVAGFDVYGNFSHQTLTRLYMDFLRMEGEFNLLALLPQEERLRLRDYWYRDASDNVKSFLYGSRAYLDYPPGIDYTSDKPAKELADILKKRLAPVLNMDHSLDNKTVPAKHREALQQLMTLQGKPATLMPEATILMVDQPDGSHQIYTITSNHAYSSLTSLLAEQKNRLPDEDNLSVIYGIGSAYPSVFMRTSEQQLDNLVKRISVLETEADYAMLLDSYGIRRTDPSFWQFSDVLHSTFRRMEPISYGLLDYNRLENR